VNEDGYTVEFVGGAWDGHSCVFPTEPPAYLSPVIVAISPSGQPSGQRSKQSLYRLRGLDPRGIYVFDFDSIILTEVTPT